MKDIVNTIGVSLMTIVIISMCFVGNVFADEAYGLVSDSHMTSSQLAEIIEIDMSNTAVATEVNKIEQTQTVIVSV